MTCRILPSGQLVPTVFLLALLLAVSAQADKRLGEVGPRYRKQWAVVVGINYAGKPAAAGSLGELHRAEGDATAVYNLLLQNYGYTADTARLLLGPQATKEALENALREGFLCHRDAVNQDDSILFFFSGHGYLRKGAVTSNDHGELLPYDLQFSGDVPNSATTIDMREMATYLSTQCAARHKLIILDCCHSGAVFDPTSLLGVGRPTAPFDERLDLALFQTPAFQAISASRKRQEAFDGPTVLRGEATTAADPDKPVDDGHSPFSYALLRALQTVPRRGGLKPITAGSLFRAMRVFLDDRLPPEQSPQCQWLSPEQGEFHFFPQGEFPDDAVADERMRQMLIAMVPGVFGNWWFEETPWLMPSLRDEIMEHLELKRSVELEVFSRDRLRAAADQAVRNLELSHEDPLTKIRLEHLRWLLAASETDRVKAYEKIATALQELTADPSQAAAVDLHFLAILLQALDRSRDDVDAAYQAAIERYETEATKHRRYLPLLALCYADHGWFLRQSMHKYEDAAFNYRRARGIFAVGTPAPFQVFTLCREADAYLELGRWKLADELMAEAIGLAEQFDPSRTHPLVASTYSRRAWASMQQWRIPDAQQRFREANETLAKYLTEHPEDFEALTAELHNDHGLAMAQRFAGDSVGALASYRRLSPRVADKLERHLNDAAGRDLNFAEVHDRLAERLVNTLERQGDCCLFGERADYGEAADDYRRALTSTDALAKARQVEWRLRLLYKRAIALAMPSPSQDLDLASGLVRRAEEVLKEEKLGLEKLPAAVRFQSNLAAALIAPQTPDEVSASPEPCDQLREILRTHMLEKGTIRNIPRDELESLMFAAKILLARESDCVRVEETCDLLLGFCRLAMSPDTLAYLRPYYDAMLRAKLRLEPKQVKDLIEIAWEATHGEAYQKPETERPTLAFHTVDDECFLFLDIPRGPSKSYSLKEFADPATAARASATGRLLPPPTALKRDLQSVSPEWRTILASPDSAALQWHDPVRGFGSAVPAGRRQVVLKPITDGEALTGADLLAPPGPSPVFPFDLSDLQTR